MDGERAVPHNLLAYVSLIQRAFKRYCNEVLQPLGLSSSNYYYLLAVVRAPGCTLTDLARQMEVDKALVTRTVGRLQELGYLRKQASPADSRAQQVFPTERCREVLAQMQPLFREWGDQLKGDYSPQEYEQLLHLLERAADRLHCL